VTVKVSNIGLELLQDVTITSVADQAAGSPAVVAFSCGSIGSIAGQSDATCTAYVTPSQANLNAGTAVSLVVTVASTGLAPVTSTAVTVDAAQTPAMKVVVSTEAASGSYCFQGEQCSDLFP
jgi:hypothetical protein